MKKVWVLIHTSDDDGNISAKVTVCGTKEVAKKEMEKARQKVVSEGYFSMLEEDDYDVKSDETSISFIDYVDGYNEYLKIEEKEIVLA